MSRSPLASELPGALGPGSVVPGSEVVSEEDVVELVRARGGRATNARRTLIHVLFTRAGHLSAEELARAVQAESPDVHVSTVYRNLEELERLGVVTHTHLGHGPATYHLAAHRHGHLVCEQCGATVEVPVALFTSLSRQADSRFGFQVDPGHSALLGRCRACRAR